MTESFIGDWSLTRTIIDHERATTIACSGTARLRRDGYASALAYDEAVSFSIAGKLIRATRVYRFFSAGKNIAATFEDGAPFFALDLSEDGSGTAPHPCGADLYTLTLKLRAPQTWGTRWEVTGTKRLTIATRYER